MEKTVLNYLFYSRHNSKKHFFGFSVLQIFCSSFFVFLYEFAYSIQFIYPFNPSASNSAQITFTRTCRLFDSIEIGQFRTNRGPNFTGGGVPCQDRKACLRCVFDRWQGQAAGYWGRGGAGRSQSQSAWTRSKDDLSRPRPPHCSARYRNVAHCTASAAQCTGRAVNPGEPWSAPHGRNGRNKL